MGNCLFSGKKRVITRTHIHDGKEYIRLIDNDYNDEVEELNEDSYHYPDNGNRHIINENENFININKLNLEELRESISSNHSEITNTNNIIQMIEKNTTENMKLLSEDIHLMHKSVLEYKTKVSQLETNQESLVKKYDNLLLKFNTLSEESEKINEINRILAKKLET